MAADTVISNIFSMMDCDGSGSISQTELNHCFKLFDNDGNGEVSREEWNDGFIKNFNGTTEQANKIYNFLDRESKGEIPIDRLFAIFKDIDSSGKGEITREEFRTYWLKLLS